MSGVGKTSEQVLNEKNSPLEEKPNVGVRAEQKNGKVKVNYSMRATVFQVDNHTICRQIKPTPEYLTGQVHVL